MSTTFTDPLFGCDAERRKCSSSSENDIRLRADGRLVRDRVGQVRRRRRGRFHAITAPTVGETNREKPRPMIPGLASLRSERVIGFHRNG